MLFFNFFKLPFFIVSSNPFTKSVLPNKFFSSFINKNKNIFSFTSILVNHTIMYPTPATISYFWNFGSLTAFFTFALISPEISFYNEITTVLNSFFDLFFTKFSFYLNEKITKFTNFDFFFQSYANSNEESTNTANQIAESTTAEVPAEKKRLKAGDMIMNTYRKQQLQDYIHGYLTYVIDSYRRESMQMVLFENVYAEFLKNCNFNEEDPALKSIKKISENFIETSKPIFLEQHEQIQFFMNFLIKLQEEEILDVNDDFCKKLVSELPKFLKKQLEQQTDYFINFHQIFHILAENITLSNIEQIKFLEFVNDYIKFEREQLYKLGLQQKSFENFYECFNRESVFLDKAYNKDVRLIFNLSQRHEEIPHMPKEFFDNPMGSPFKIGELDNLTFEDTFSICQEFKPKWWAIINDISKPEEKRLLASAEYLNCINFEQMLEREIEDTLASIPNPKNSSAPDINNNNFEQQRDPLLGVYKINSKVHTIFDAHTECTKLMDYWWHTRFFDNKEVDQLSKDMAAIEFHNCIKIESLLEKYVLNQYSISLPNEKATDVIQGLSDEGYLKNMLAVKDAPNTTEFEQKVAQELITIKKELQTDLVLHKALNLPPAPSKELKNILDGTAPADHIVKKSPVDAWKNATKEIGELGFYKSNSYKLKDFYSSEGPYRKFSVDPEKTLESNFARAALECISIYKNKCLTDSFKDSLINLDFSNLSQKEAYELIEKNFKSTSCKQLFYHCEMLTDEIKKIQRDENSDFRNLLITDISILPPSQYFTPYVEMDKTVLGTKSIAAQTQIMSATRSINPFINNAYFTPLKQNPINDFLKQMNLSREAYSICQATFGLINDYSTQTVIDLIIKPYFDFIHRPFNSEELISFCNEFKTDFDKTVENLPTKFWTLFTLYYNLNTFYADASIADLPFDTSPFELYQASLTIRRDSSPGTLFSFENFIEYLRFKNTGEFSDKKNSQIPFSFWEDINVIIPIGSVHGTQSISTVGLNDLYDYQPDSWISACTSYFQPEFNFWFASAFLRHYATMQTLSNVNFYNFIASLLIFSFINLIKAKKPVVAIFSFFFFIITTTIIFFIFKSDYVGVIHLIVYPGAIIIFFIFVTLTTDSQWFNFSAEQKFFRFKNVNHVNKALFFQTLVNFIIFWKTQQNIISFSASIPDSNQMIVQGRPSFLFSNSSSVVEIGNLIFNQYKLALNGLGCILLFALFISISLLMHKNVRFSFSQTFGFNLSTFLNKNLKKKCFELFLTWIFLLLSHF